MNLVFLGSGEFGIDSLNALKESDQRLRFIVTQPPHPAGRGRKESPTFVAQWAQNHSIPFVESDNVNAPQDFNRIAAYEPDIIVVIAFGQKIGSDLINLPPKGAINVHASLLPKLRGAAPINWAIINGETETGISIITLAEKMDTGKIIAQVKTEIKPYETAGVLHDRLAQMAAPLLIKTLDKIEAGKATYTEQDHTKATLAPKLKKSNGFVDFNEPAELLERKIRGFWPWPGASANYLSKSSRWQTPKTDKATRVTFAKADVVQTSNLQHLQVGTLDNNLNIICGKDALKIRKLKPAGSNLMDFADFVNGRHSQTGDIFVKI
jgi:methionyl-tRNA formyltransferase